MATVAAPRTDRNLLESVIASLPAGRRLLLADVSWSDFRAALDFRDAARPRVRLTYFRGTVEVMTKSNFHERYLYLLGRFVSCLTEELKVPAVGCRETTVERDDLEHMFEPDEWFYLGDTAARMAKVAITRRFDFATDPPPDLALEVEITRSLLDRLGLYAALGVKEIWRFDGEALTVSRLTRRKKYRDHDRSTYFPGLDPADLVSFLQKAGDGTDSTLLPEFRAWVRAALVPAG